MRHWLISTLVAVVALPVPANSKPAEQAGVLKALLDCRTLTDDAARLACYDRQAAEIGGATERDELVVMDKEAVRKTRRSLFGFSLPRLPFLSGGDDDAGKDGERDGEEPANRIEAKVQSVRSLAMDKWAFVLDDGARWETVEALGGRDPRAGGTVLIKRAALGSFMAQFDGGRWVRVKRVN